MTKVERVRREIELVAFSRISDVVNISASGITLTENAKAWVDQLSGGGLASRYYLRGVLSCR